MGTKKQMEILVYRRRVFEQLKKIKNMPLEYLRGSIKRLFRRMSFYWRIIVDAKEPEEILTYGQKIFEQICHEKKTKSLLRHLNDNVCARKLDRLNEVIVFDEVKKSYISFKEMLDKKYIRNEIEEEDLAKFIDWYLVIFELSYQSCCKRIGRFGYIFESLDTDLISEPSHIACHMNDVGFGYLLESVEMDVGSFIFNTMMEKNRIKTESYIRILEKYAVGTLFRQIIIKFLSYSVPLEEYLRRGMEGDKWVYHELGYIYENGLYECVQDYAEAAKWYTKATEQSEYLIAAGAYYPLGRLYALGLGVEQDDKRAVHWYRKAAEQGFAIARYELGKMYALGRGVAQDDEVAMQWYYLAAEAGLPAAQHELGKRYTSGSGVTQDDEKAQYWYQRAKGIPSSEHPIEQRDNKISYEFSYSASLFHSNPWRTS